MVWSRVWITYFRRRLLAYADGSLAWWLFPSRKAVTTIIRFPTADPARLPSLQNYPNALKYTRPHLPPKPGVDRPVPEIPPGSADAVH